MRDYISTHITGVYVTDANGEPTQGDILDYLGESLLEPQEPIAPALVTPGAITPASGPVGTVFTITPPVFSGSPTPTVTRTMTLAGAPITVTGNSYTSTSAGALAAAWSASNGVGSPTTSSASATVTAAGAAPVITQQPSITPSSATVGDSVTLNLGAATGAVGPPTWTLMLDETDVTDQVSGDLVYVADLAGDLTLNVLWSNATGTTAANPATITVSGGVTPVIPDYSQALLHFDENTTTAPDAIGDITNILTDGLREIALPTTGTGAAMTRAADGIGFAAGAYAQSANNLTNQGAEDGFFIVAEVTVSAHSGTNAQIANGSGHGIRLTDANGTLQVLAVGPGTSGQVTVNQSVGSTTYGARQVIGGRIEKGRAFLDVFTASGAHQSVALALDPDADIVPTRYNFGRYLDGTIHRLAIFGRPLGGEWAETFEDVCADFTLGV